MAKLTKAKLKKILQEQSKEQLIDTMMTLFANKDIAEQINLIYNKDYETEYLEQAKKKIYKSFFPTRTSINTKISAPKKIVTDFCKLSNNYYNIADLQLYYVETVLEILDLECITDSLLNTFVDMLWESVISMNHLDRQQYFKFFLASTIADTNS